METNNDYLAHHGIKGQKWGIRRYQNEDGTLTTEGKKRYSKNDGDKDRAVLKKALVGVGAVTVAAASAYALSKSGIFTKEGLKTIAESASAVKKASNFAKATENFGDKAIRASRAKAVNDRRTMSTEELKKRIERLKLEKELKNLTNEDQAFGLSYISNLSKGIAGKVVSTIATGALLYGTKALISGEYNAKEMGSAVFNGGPKKK